MMLADRLMANTRIVPIAPDRQVQSVRRLSNGDLEVTQRSGNVFTLPKEEETLQAFIIWSVLERGF